MYRCILQGRKPATCQFRRCSKCITGGYYPPLRRFCCHNAIKSRRAGACSRVNCTQCKRHEAPNASAFGRNSPGDCFVASALIPLSLPTANPPPNRCPSPLSLRDISPHRGESPVTREANRLQDFSPLPAPTEPWEWGRCPPPAFYWRASTGPGPGVACSQSPGPSASWPWLPPAGRSR